MSTSIQALTISDLERASGVPRSTIHFYVRKGLLPRPQMTAGTRALYSQDHVVLLERIRTAKLAGRSLPQIKADLRTDLTQLGESNVDLLAHEYEKTHRHILNVATREFVRNGYRRTHVADLIRDLGISSSVFYTHFRSKHHLLVECFTTYIEWARTITESIADGHEDAIERQIIRTSAGIAIHKLGADVLAQVSAERLQAENELRAPVEEAWSKVLGYLSDEIAQMRGPGSAPPPFPDEVLAYSLNGGFQTSLTRTVWDPKFNLLDVVRVQVWLWLVIRAAESGRVDVSGEMAAYEEAIRKVVSEPLPPFPAAREQR